MLQGLLFQALEYRGQCLVLGGVALSMWRRLRDGGAKQSVLRTGFLPIIPYSRVRLTGHCHSRVRQKWHARRVLRVFFSRTFARDHRDRRAALSPV